MRLLLPEGDQYKDSANPGGRVHRDSERHWDGLPTLDCQTCDHAAAGQRTTSLSGGDQWRMYLYLFVSCVSVCNLQTKFLVSLRWWPTWCRCQPQSSDCKASYWLLSGSAWPSGSSRIVSTVVLRQNIIIVSEKQKSVLNLLCKKFEISDWNLRKLNSLYNELNSNLCNIKSARTGNNISDH